MKNLDKYLTLLDGDVDGLLLTSRYSRHYGAEFDIAEGVAIVTKKGCRYFTDSRYIESAEKNLKGFEVLDVNREIGYIQRLNTAIADFGVTTLGYEEHYLTAEEYFYYDEKLNAKLVPFHKPIYAFRATKEDWELELMRKAQAITDRAFAEVITRIKPGMTELELQAELIYCMYKNGGTGLAFDPIVVSGPNTSLPHGVAGERVIQKGDFVTMDFGANVDGYCTDMTRTVAVGHVSDEQKKVYDTVLKAQLACCGFAKAGYKGCEVDKVARDIIYGAGYEGCFGHGLGHAVGIEIHENPRYSPTCSDIIQSGMVMTIEPGIYLPGKFGVRIEDTTFVRPDGCEIVGKSPKELIVL